MQRLADLCVRRPVLARVITLVMVVLGTFSFLSLNVSRYPNVDLPIITIITRSPGIAPAAVETDVTRPIENAVSGIDGIDKVTSTSAAGVSIVVAQFALEKDVNVAAQEVRDKLGAISNLPAGTAPSQVLRFDPNQIPVVIAALSADRPVQTISEYAAQTAAPRLEGAPGVAQVTLVGDRPRQIDVVVRPDRLAARGLTVSELLSAIQTPAGNLSAAAQQFITHTFTRLSDLADLPVMSPGGRPVRVEDVARVQDGVAPARTVANVNGTTAVLLYVQKQSGANTLDVARAIKARLQTLQPGLPPGYDLRVVWDQSEYVQASTRAVEEHLIAGSILAALVVLLFLWDWRATIIAALAIPISLISTFTLLAALHLTLNTFTLLALALVIGIVIDDAIVVLESIYRFVHEQGRSPMEAAVEGTRAVGPAVMATTVSLLVVFLPLAFMHGIVGRFMSSFGWTMAFAIAVSLVVSFTLTPSLASRWLATRRPAARSDERAEPGPSPEVPVQRAQRERTRGAMEAGYRWLLDRSLRRRWVLVVLAALTLASIAPLAMLVNQDLLPAEDESQFEVVVKAPVDWSLDRSAAIATTMAAEIRRLSGVAFTVVTAGDDPQHSPNRFTIFVRMTPVQARAVTQQQEMALVRRTVLPKFQSDGLVALVNDVSDLTEGTAPLQYVISGPDLAVLGRAADAAIAYLRTIPGVVDIQSSLGAGQAWDVKVDPARAAALGVSPGDAADTLALLTQGIDARGVAYEQGGRFYAVHVGAEVPGAPDPSALAQVPVVSSSGRPVTLGEVVDVRPTPGPGEITHFNRERDVTISANLLAGTSLGSVVDRLDARMRALRLPPGYHQSLAGISEQVAQTERAFTQAFVAAFVFMYLVLAAYFESWVHPITILLSLPLTVPFALVSILLLHGSLNPLSYLGILVLFGVVKKNAILQVARANELRAQGAGKDDAIVRASLERLRPILMTTIAFVAGMIPLAVSRGVGSASGHAISTVIIGGQMLSLLLTLAAVPVIYSLFDDLGRLQIAGWFARRPRDLRPAVRAADGGVPQERPT
jgi:HAE1 family hydrophobic/amphiphilic exporter-1